MMRALYVAVSKSLVSIRYPLESHTVEENRHAVNIVGTRDDPTESLGVLASPNDWNEYQEYVGCCNLIDRDDIGYDAWHDTKERAYNKFNLVFMDKLSSANMTAGIPLRTLYAYEEYCAVTKDGWRTPESFDKFMTWFETMPVPSKEALSNSGQARRKGNGR